MCGQRRTATPAGAREVSELAVSGERRDACDPPDVQAAMDPWRGGMARAARRSKKWSGGNKVKVCRRFWL